MAGLPMLLADIPRAMIFIGDVTATMQKIFSALPARHNGDYHCAASMARQVGFSSTLRFHALRARKMGYL